MHYGILPERYSSTSQSRWCPRSCPPPTPTWRQPTSSRPHVKLKIIDMKFSDVLFDHTFSVGEVSEARTTFLPRSRAEVRMVVQLLGLLGNSFVQSLGWLENFPLCEQKNARCRSNPDLSCPPCATALCGFCHSWHLLITNRTRHVVIVHSSTGPATSICSGHIGGWPWTFNRRQTMCPQLPVLGPFESGKI